MHIGFAVANGYHFASMGVSSSRIKIDPIYSLHLLQILYTILMADSEMLHAEERKIVLCQLT